MNEATLFSYLWPTLGLTIAHFLWQGFLIAAITAIVLAILRRATPACRYMVNCVSMIFGFVVFVTTFILIFSQSGEAPLSGLDSDLLMSSTILADSPVSEAQHQIDMTMSIIDESTGTLPAKNVTFWQMATAFWSINTLAWMWLAGALFMLTRFAVQWNTARYLKTNLVITPDQKWHRLFDEIKAKMGINKGIKILQSSLVETPMVIGWMSPVVLIPTSVFTSLTTDQIRMILTHELAHIRRYDHLVNIAQGAIEIMLFFHPMTWWLSKNIRIEREYCCDDAAITVTSKPRLFAEALIELEALRIKRQNQLPNTALALTGGSLMSRIKRIVNPVSSQDANRLQSKTPLALLLTLLLLMSGMTYVASTAYATANAGNETSEAIQDHDGHSHADHDDHEHHDDHGHHDEHDIDFEHFPDDQELRDMIAEGVEEGEVSRRQAGDIMTLHKELQTQIADGELSKQEAARVFHEEVLQLLGWNDHDEDETDSRRMIFPTHEALRSRIEDGLREGDVNREQAAQIMAIYERFQAGIESGRMSHEDAGPAFRNRVMAMLDEENGHGREDHQHRDDHHDQGHDHHDQGHDRIMAARIGGMLMTLGEAVESGRMSPEDAMRQIMETAERMGMMQHHEHDERHAEFERQERELMEAVRRGDISEEDAHRRLKEMERHMMGGDRDHQRRGDQGDGMSKEDYNRAVDRLKRGVESGNISEEDADRRIEEMKREMKRQSRGDDDHMNADQQEEYMKRVSQRLEKAVESGRMTEREAKDKYAEMEREMHERMRD